MSQINQSDVFCFQNYCVVGKLCKKKILKIKQYCVCTLKNSKAAVVINQLANEL